MTLTTSHHLRLAQLAERTGLGISDVALLAGVDETTIGRLWSAPDWLDRVRGRTLQALIAAVPGVAEFVADAPQQRKLAALADQLAGEGVQVDGAQADHLVTQGIPRPYVLHALDVCLRIVREDLAATTEFLPRFWGRIPDGALSALFQPGGLVVDSAPLVAAAAELVPRMQRRSYSFNAVLAQANLAHHVAKATGAPVELRAGPGRLDRRAAFALRSTTMGALTGAEDTDAAEQYRRLVEAEPVVRLVEEWAFPSWTRDCRPSADMNLPGSLLLRNTAAEVLREVAAYGGGYLYYLVTTYLPLALQQDPTFGLRAADLRAALVTRHEIIADPAIRRAVESFVRLLPTGAAA